MLMDFAGIFSLTIGYSQNLDLYRCEPQGQIPSAVLKEDGDETLKRAQNCPVQHDRGRLAAFRCYIPEPEPLEHGAVDLYRSKRPRTLEYVTEVEADLWSVKCALAW